MIDRITELIEKATPGPWGRDGEDSANFGVRGAPPDGNILAIVQQDGRGGRWDDAAFIAQARQLLPLMLGVVDAADSLVVYPEGAFGFEELAEAQAALDAYCAEHLPEAK